jgi:hypothetical protein
VVFLRIANDRKKQIAGLKAHSGAESGYTTEIGSWLSELGLPQYASRLVENGIDLSVLRDLTRI